MAETKYNLVRLKRLIAMLKENRYPNYPRFLAEMKKMDAAGAYTLSARTLQRDVAFLKSEYRAPIQYDYERRGYCLTEPDWCFDVPLLDEKEMKAAVIGARLAENIVPAPVKQEVRQAVDSLLAVNDKGMDEKSTLLSLVAMGSRAAIKPEIFRPVFDAWQSHHRLAIRYEQVTGRLSSRIIEPHALAFFEGNWYVKAVTTQKNGVAIAPAKRRASAFALHRITAAELVPERFIPDDKIIRSVNDRQLFDFPLVKEIRLQLTQEARKFIGEEFDVVDEGKIGGDFLVCIPAAPEYRIVNYVLVEAGEAKLLNHPELKKLILQRARRCIAKQEE